MGIGKAIRRLPVVTPAQRREDRIDTDLKWMEEPPGLPPRIDFGTIYETFSVNYTNSVEHKEKRRRGIFHPSSGLHHDSGNCPRTVIFGLLLAPLSKTAIPSLLCKVLDAGNNRHVGLQAVFKNMAKAQYMGIVAFADEVPCSHHTLPLAGHMDGLVQTKAGYRYALDFKTWSSKNCEKTFAPEWKHFLQLTTYMGLYGVKAGYVIYENKDNQKWLGPPDKFRVNFDPKVYGEIEQYCFDILQFVVNKEMPIFDEKTCKANIMFCPYAGVCGKENDGQLKWDDYDMRDEQTKQVHTEAANGHRG